jgi:hypothetical protein
MPSIDSLDNAETGIMRTKKRTRVLTPIIHTNLSKAFVALWMTGDQDGNAGGNPASMIMSLGLSVIMLKMFL